MIMEEDRHRKSLHASAAPSQHGQGFQKMVTAIVTCSRLPASSVAPAGNEARPVCIETTLATSDDRKHD